MTKQDFLDWKTHPVTRAVAASFQEKIDELKSRLVGETLDPEGVNPAATAGAVRAFEAFFSIDFEELSND